MTRSPLKLKATRQAPALPISLSADLLGDVRALIDAAREHTARAINGHMVVLYWQVGRRIREDVLDRERASYGQRVVELLAHRLTREYGRGFTRAALFRMLQFAERFPRQEIVATLSRHLAWSHFVELIAIEDDLKRNFYAEMCRTDGWSIRTLRDRICSMLFERTALSRKPANLARQELNALRSTDRMTPDLVFRDPYVLDFLGLADSYSERDLEAAILKDLERFLLELGTDFSFVARQKRMTIGGEEFFLDLLFFHRRLRALVAVELKLGRFTPAHKGQVELYLRWLDHHERRPGEE